MGCLVGACDWYRKAMLRLLNQLSHDYLAFSPGAKTTARQTGKP